MNCTGSPSSPLQIFVSPTAGRSYRTTRHLPAGTCVLDVSTPYTCTVYKQFRNEVCAECWRYDGGRRSFLTCRDYGESAGLSFCDERCRDVWLAREGHQAVELLQTLEAARRKKDKGKEKAVTNTTVVLTGQDIERTWQDVEREQANKKCLQRWRDIHLDDFEADMARYVLMALYHYAQDSLHTTPSVQDDTVFSSFGACWDSFAILQSGEMRQVTRFPELLDDHIAIYHVLKTRFGTPNDASSVLAKLADLITVRNVRIALGVDPGNSFGIWEVPVTEESEGLGFGVYPIPSFFNHHCSPNVRKERVGRRLRFVTTRDVEPEEELCISYGQVEGMVWQQRRKELKDGWFFECQCSRCIADMQAQK